MEKLNYELVGKRATIECLLNGEIDVSELPRFYLLDIYKQQITLLTDATTEEIFNAITDQNVLFVQKITYTNDMPYEDEEDDWEDDVVIAPVKKKRR